MIILRFWIGLLAGPVAACVVASALCSQAILRDRVPRWWYAAIAVPAGLAVSLYGMFGGAGWTMAAWRGEIGEKLWFVFKCGSFSWIAVTALATVAVIGMFRGRFAKHLLPEQAAQLRHAKEQARRERTRRLSLAASAGLVAVSACWMIRDLTTDSTVDRPVTDKLARHGFVDGVDPLPMWPLCVVGMGMGAVWWGCTMTLGRGDLRGRRKDSRSSSAKATEDR